MLPYPRFNIDQKIAWSIYEGTKVPTIHLKNKMLQLPLFETN